MFVVRVTLRFLARCDVGELDALIPWPYRLLVLALLSAALVGFGWVKGAGHVQAEWDAAVAKQSLQVVVVQKRQAEATVQVMTKYVDRVKIVRQAGETLIKEVPVYVPAQADAACVVPRGFVRLHDAATQGVVPEPAGDFDAAPADIALSAVAGTVAENYTACRENAEQLSALQSWILRMQESAGTGLRE